MASASTDPVIQDVRQQISEIDLRILEALNARIRLVKSLKDYKESQGIGFVDAAQEDRVLAHLCQANGGPLSEEGLREIFQLILEWAKRDASTLGKTQAP